MAKYPLLFTLRRKVSGDDYLADITAHGRALATQEVDGSWWIYGVQPGALAGTGSTLLEAYTDFRRTFTAVLYDTAHSAASFWAFKEAVGRFFDETDGVTVQEWLDAVTEVRAGRVTAKDIPLGPNGIRQESAESPRYITVECIKKFRSADNVLDPTVAVAA